MAAVRLQDGAWSTKGAAVAGGGDVLALRDSTGLDSWVAIVHPTQLATWRDRWREWRRDFERKRQRRVRRQKRGWGW